MKKLFLNAIKFCVALTVAGCGHGDPTFDGPCLMRTETSDYSLMWSQFSETLELEYAPDLSLVAIIRNNDRHVVTNDDRGNVIRLESEWNGAVSEFEYDSENRMTLQRLPTVYGYETFAYEYSSSTGQVIRAVWTTAGDDPIVWEYTYEYPHPLTNNPSRIQVENKEIGYGWVHDFSYDEHKPPTGDLNRLLFDRMNPAENNVRTASVSTGSGTSSPLFGECVYVYNAAGYPEQVTITYTNGDVVVKRYVYSCQ